MTFEQLILQQRPHVEQVIQDLARRHYLAPAEIDEFREAIERVLERNDYELLRAFDGRSTWETYLTTVLTRQFFVFQTALWGQWRPSAAACRMGPAAMLLEELTLRDRIPVQDAIEFMRVRHRVDLPRHRLQQMAAELGVSVSRTPTSAGANARVLRDARLQSALRDALALVSPDDRLMLELRFRDRQPLTRIAQVLKTEARPLQRRIETATDVIRTSLLTQGIPTEDVEALLRHADSDAVHPDQTWWNSVLSRPSNK